MSKPIAVLISDIHFSPATLELASKALIAAREKAFQLKIPLILCGDTLDTKAIIRAECANRLLEILAYRPYNHVETYILVGNHDLINEKGTEHSLNFLKGSCSIIDTYQYLPYLDTHFLPYTGNAEALKTVLYSIPKGSRIIMHQGVQTAYMGHYIQDKTSLSKEAFADFRVISGHYHRAQDIKCGRPRKGSVGLFSYIGNPYTLSFSEANDGPKGYQILNEDGTLTQVPLNLRKHIIIELNVKDTQKPIPNYNVGDLVQVKLKGTKVELDALDKQLLGMALIGSSEFKLDKIYTEVTRSAEPLKKVTSSTDILDNLIDLLEDNDDTKSTLKALWRDLLNETTKS